MGLIGGVACGDPVQPVAPLLQAMARRVAGAREPAWVGQGHVGLISCLDSGAPDPLLAEFTATWPTRYKVRGLQKELWQRRHLGAVEGAV